MNWFSVSSSRHTMDRSGRLKIIHLWKLFPVTSWSCQEGFHHQGVGWIQQARHQVARRVILGKASIPLPVRRGIRSGWSRMMSLHLGRRLFLHHLVMLSLTCLMINRKLLDMSTFLRLQKDQMVRRLQFLIGAVMIVRSEGRLKWSLHLILTLPGDVQRASPGWMFLEFVTMLSVERSELVFKLNHHLQGPRWVCHLVLHLLWLCQIFLQLHYPQRIWPLWISRCWMVQQVLMRIQLRPWSLGWWICVSVECCSIHRVCQVWIWWAMFDSMSNPLHMMGAKVNVRWLISAGAVWNFGSHLMSSRIQLLVSLIRKALSKPCRRNVMGWQPWRLVSSLASRRKKSSASVMGWSLLPAVGLRMRSQNLMKASVPGLWWRTLQEAVRQRARLQYPAQRPAWSRWGWFWEHLVAFGEQNWPFMPSMWPRLSWTHHFVTKNESFSGCHLASRQHQESRFSWKHTRHLTVCVWRALLGACFWRTLYPRLAWLAAQQSRVFMVGWLMVPLPCF